MSDPVAFRGTQCLSGCWLFGSQPKDRVHSLQRSIDVDWKLQLQTSKPLQPSLQLQSTRCPGSATGRFLSPVAAARFRPCIDIHKGKVKQIVGSTLKDLAPANGGDVLAGHPDPDPVVNFESEKSSREYSEMYKDDNLPGGHVIMLGADDASKRAALEALAAYPGGLQLGGGVNADNANEYLDAGASHVIVTSYVFRDGVVDMDRLRSLVGAVGRSQLVLDLSCRKKDGQYLVVTDRWQRFSDLVVGEESLADLAAFCDEFLVHGVDVEGMRLGIDHELVALLGKYSPIPVTYAGGARTLADLEVVSEAGAGRVDVTVGSALDIFGGGLKYRDVVAWHRRQLVPASQK